ncbi:cobaltochelatase CobT-related protein [Qipengyuania vesicularis]|uniref:cobaltochelatase CobT-related protein n=1 Tax=Qipengyuania vesicularis TaxID=2867232 RepID=UPI001C8733BA|nr:hypothetical protein [Qipengyuania vesicularis]MBX7526787.1 hypothetical protein [Qipengyuania vesicularis]
MQFFGFLVFAIAIAVVWYLARLGQSHSAMAADRPDIPYRAFTTEFDLEIRAEELPDLLLADGEVDVLPRGKGPTEFEGRLREMQSAHAAAVACLEEVSPPLPINTFVLLDMSGSMAERMPRLVGELKALHEWSVNRGFPLAIGGFTTRGWRGGLAREKWINSGRPDYPGRLCALLHLNIAESGVSAHDDAWHAIIRADALRENIDGEAIRWAARKYPKGNSAHTILIVVSDGAPVDDSTLMQNGPNYLWRDLEAAICEIEGRTDISLKAIGIDHRIDDLYEDSTFISDEDELVAALLHAFNSQNA